MRLQRLFRHLIAPSWVARQAFPAETLEAIEAAVKSVERHHAGELRFVVESGLPLGLLLRDVSARQRAIDVFAQLRVWDTEQNNGVLVYLQLIDRRVEIVADRGINAKVAQSHWEAICRDMEVTFRVGAYGRGALQAIESIGSLLAEHFPAAQESDAAAANELPDRPVLL
ncbi:MAG: TPM domain-containing protein [Proteobacteria bacterium]|nr:TPM domain-containing protein [Pseudomonadota bacterium]